MWEFRSLDGQPAIPVFREFPFLDEKGPPNAGFSYCGKSLETDVRTFSAKIPLSLQPNPGKLPFSGDWPGDRRTSAVRLGAGRALTHNGMLLISRNRFDSKDSIVLV
jgi:hypothetical protein